MEQDLFDLEPDQDRSLLEREERCQKAIKAVSKAVFMRLVICGLLIWSVFSTNMELWAAGLMILVMVINCTGLIPLIAELKKRRTEWKSLLEEEEE
jgi:membrane protein involved in colicin uptake